jgi:drug/metabolite transporter (DMT)-like permease
MAYGTLLMLMVALVTGKEFELVLSTPYVTALVYLAVFGSIVAFGCYLSLVGRIGADRAAYATLLFPIVALLFSTIWENYHWTSEAVTGVALILLGNLLMVKKSPGPALRVKGSGLHS